MTPDETALVLTKASAFDQRTIGEADVMAWHSVLEDIPVDDALQAVSNHYRDSTTRLWPADVRRLAAEIDYKRRGAIRKAELEAKQPALPSAPADPRRVKELVREVAAKLPVVESVRIHERAKTRARNERGRPEPLKPRQFHKPEKPKKKPRYEDPVSDDVARMATRYLIDGYEPEVVSEKFAISRKWCEKTARKFRAT